MQIDELFAEAYSIESMPKDRSVKYIGMKISGGRVYKLYKDNIERIWYQTFFIDEDTREIITEEEKIFGRKLKKTPGKEKHLPGAKHLKTI